MDDFERGWEHQRAGRLGDAEACYRRFVAGNPTHAAGWVALGGVAVMQQNYEEAETQLLQAFKGLELRASQSPAQVKGRLIEVVDRLVQLYKAWDKQDEAAKWRKELEKRKAPV